MRIGDIVHLSIRHLETQFPKTCPRCQVTYRARADYLGSTTRLGAPVSYDAALGDWRPAQPLGTMAMANCRCGTTLSLTSAGMGADLHAQVMAWARTRCEAQQVTLVGLLAELRDAIEAEVLRRAASGGPTSRPPG